MSTPKHRCPPTGPSARLVDEMISAYDDWLEECLRVRQCYLSWNRAPRAERALAFAAYESALDGEQSAADQYRHVAGRLGATAHELRPHR